MSWSGSPASGGVAAAGGNGTLPRTAHSLAAGTSGPPLNRQQFIGFQRALRPCLEVHYSIFYIHINNLNKVGAV